MSEVANNYNIEAHYSNDMKVKRPNVTSFEAPQIVPKHHLFSDKDASKKMQKINTDRNRSMNSIANCILRFLAELLWQPQVSPVLVRYDNGCAERNNP